MIWECSLSAIVYCNYIIFSIFSCLRFCYFLFSFPPYKPLHVLQTPALFQIHGFISSLTVVACRYVCVFLCVCVLCACVYSILCISRSWTFSQIMLNFLGHKPKQTNKNTREILCQLLTYYFSTLIQLGL